MVITVFAKYVKPLSIKFVLRVSGITQMYVISSDRYMKFMTTPSFAFSSFSILLSTCLVLQHGSFVPRE